MVGAFAVPPVSANSADHYWIPRGLADYLSNLSNPLRAASLACSSGLLISYRENDGS